MRVWIDATRLDESLRVFGMSLLERQLRALLEVQKSFAELDDAAAKLDGLVSPQPRLTGFLQRSIRPSEVRIELAADAEEPQQLPAELFSMKKHGFTAPVASWLRGDLESAFRDEVLSPDARCIFCSS